MSLYTPSAFVARDRTAVSRLMHDHPFATLVTPGTPGVTTVAKGWSCIRRDTAARSCATKAAGV